MKKIIPILIVLLFATSTYLFVQSYLRFSELSFRRHTPEVVAILKILNDKFSGQYSLPETSFSLITPQGPSDDIELDESILEYLNANRNQWQYEYVKNPVKATDQSDYTLKHFEFQDDKISTLLNSVNIPYKNWTYYKETENYNHLVRDWSENIRYKMEPEIERIDYWTLLLNSFWHYESEKAKFWNNGFDAIITYGATVTYPDGYLNFRDNTEEREEILRKGTITYFQEEIANHDRDTASFQAAWTENKQFFFELFPKQRYEDLVEPVVENLLNTYDVVTQTNDYKEHFKKYNVNDFEFYDLPNTEQFRYTEFLSWSYSFWDRRFTEGTMEYVHTILLEIKAHY
ncbi:hypothetical protein [Reichenbachiella versicolor]|uniref:hypothetical protein n=1 Tax=Reichenbachiella versicolor TaxID=1821036 RepID=UPI000D6E0165|nr:hypothetical protein [Reichenbachiella versicolor]